MSFLGQNKVNVAKKVVQEMSTTVLMCLAEGSTEFNQDICVYFGDYDMGFDKIKGNRPIEILTRIGVQ